MNYFKDTNDQVFAYDDVQVQQGYASGKTQMTDEEVQLHLNPPKTVEQINAEKVAEAKAYLANTDYKMLPNYVPKVDEDLDAIIAKRNETREFIRNNNA